MALIGPGFLSPAPRAIAPRLPATPYGGPTPATTPSTTAPPAPFNYTDLLKNDPILGQALAGYNAAGVANQAGLTAAQQRALIQYGSVPSGSLPGVNQIDETTRKLAEQNTAAGTSTVANLKRGYDLSQQSSDASLAARGILRSGAYGQHAAENLQGYNQGQYQATNALTDYLQGIYSGYLQQQQQLQQSGVGATNDALQRIIALIQAGYYTGGQAGPRGNKDAPTIEPPQNGLAPNDAYRLLNPTPAQSILNRGRGF